MFLYQKQKKRKHIVINELLQIRLQIGLQINASADKVLSLLALELHRVYFSTSLLLSLPLSLSFTLFMIILSFAYQQFLFGAHWKSLDRLYSIVWMATGRTAYERKIPRVITWGTFTIHLQNVIEKGRERGLQHGLIVKPIKADYSRHSPVLPFSSSRIPMPPLHSRPIFRYLSGRGRPVVHFECK